MKDDSEYPTLWVYNIEYNIYNICIQKAHYLLEFK